MKIAQINIVPNGSTGKIMLQIAHCARSHGYSARTFSPIIFDKYEPKITITEEGHFGFGSYAGNKIHAYLGIITGGNGLFSFKGTRDLIMQLEMYKPDIVHLHNLHKFCINLPMLFNYLKTHDVKVVWTLHDCWAFTGHCPYFTMVGCDKWKNGCHNCTQIGIYPKSLIDNSKIMYQLKKKWFNNVKNMTIVTPSVWLSELVKQSFLGNYPIKVIKPVKSNFREKYGISEKKNIILGVSFGWGRRKGLDVFLKLAEVLDDDKYQIVLVGTSDVIDAQLSKNIISIHKTNDQQELAEIYSAADLFVNPTREENYPTVNMEAIACGTPVVTFNTGGSPEILDENSGIVVECDDIDSLICAINHICKDKLFSEQSCVEKSKSFNADLCFEKYVELYSLISEKE